MGIDLQQPWDLSRGLTIWQSIHSSDFNKVELKGINIRTRPGIQGRVIFYF
jgi:hypothetical protein